MKQVFQNLSAPLPAAPWVSTLEFRVLAQHLRRAVKTLFSSHSWQRTVLRDLPPRLHPDSLSLPGFHRRLPPSAPRSPLRRGNLCTLCAAAPSAELVAPEGCGQRGGGGAPGAPPPPHRLAVLARPASGPRDSPFALPVRPAGHAHPELGKRDAGVKCQ